MSEKFKNFDRIYRRYLNDHNQDAYRESRGEEKETEMHKGLPGAGAPKYLMDADQLLEYYEKRNYDADPLSFKARTIFYFRDSYGANGKALRYQNIQNNPASIEQYRQQYGGRKAWKRKGDATEAKCYFNDMSELINRQYQDNEQNMTPIQKFNRREAVMKLRMSGMMAAARLKSRPGNMNHSICRAQLSCWMLLKDQLTHLMREQMDAADMERMTRKLENINHKIKTTMDKLRHFTPSAQKQWQDAQFVELEFNMRVAEYGQQVRPDLAVSDETAKTFYYIKKLREQNPNVQWPVRCVYRDRSGMPLNVAERKLEEWNLRARQIYAYGTDYAKQRLEEEGIKVFMTTKFPKLWQLKSMGTKYLLDNLRTFYEMTQHAYSYYQAQMGIQGSFVQNYAQTHPEFVNRMIYVDSIRKYMNYRLSKDLGIKYDAQQGYVIRRDGPGVDINGAQADQNPAQRARQERDREQSLEQTLNAAQELDAENAAVYETGNLMPEIPVDAQDPHAVVNNDNHAQDDAAEDPHEEQPQEVHEPQEEKKEKAAPKIDPLKEIDENKNEIKRAQIGKGEKKNRIGSWRDAPGLAPIEEEKKKEKIIKIEEEDEKIENGNEIIEEEDNKNQIIEEKDDGVYINGKKAGDLRKKSRKNKNLIKEEDEILIKEEKYEKEAPPRMITEPGELTDHTEYQKLIGESKGVFTKYFDEEQNRDEAVSSMMRLVHFGQNGEPLTKQDTKNHEWNLKWLRAWRDDDFETREKMIDEELSNIGAQMTGLPMRKVQGEKLNLLQSYDLDKVNQEKKALLDKINDTKKTSDQDQANIVRLGETQRVLTELSFTYQNVLDKFVQNQILDQGNDALLAALQKMKTIGVLKKAHPGLSDYCTKNAVFQCYVNIAGGLTDYIDLYRQKNFGKKKHQDSDIPERMTSIGLKILKMNQVYYAHEKDKYKSYASVPFIVVQTEKEKKEELERELRTRKVMDDLEITQTDLLQEYKKGKVVDSESLKLSKKRYEILKYYKQTSLIEAHKDYQEIYKKTGIKNTLGRTLSAMMKPVLFDKNGTPLPKYQKNHQWNLRWLQTWVPAENEEERKEKEKEKTRMIQEYAPHILDGFGELPQVKLDKKDLPVISRYARALREMEKARVALDAKKEELKKSGMATEAQMKKDAAYAELSGKYQALKKQKLGLEGKASEIARKYSYSSEFAGWIDQRMKDRSDHEIIRHMTGNVQGSVDGLKALSPEFREFMERNPKFVRKSGMVDKLHFAFNRYISNNYGVSITGTYRGIRDWKDDDEARTGGLDQQGMDQLLLYLTDWADYYYPQTQQKEDDEKELESLRNTKNENFSDKDYTAYKKLKSIKELHNNPIYKSIFEGPAFQATSKKYGLGKDASLDRFYRIGFKPVTFDRLNQPVTKRDEENHAWNLKWLKAWEEDDATTREQMIGEILPGIYDGLDLPNIKISKKDEEALLRMKNAEDAAVEADRKRGACQSEMNALEKELKRQGIKKEDSKEYQQLQKKYDLLHKEYQNANRLSDKANESANAIAETYRKTFTKWLENQAGRQDYTILSMSLHAGSFDELRKIHPSVDRFFQKNPLFTRTTEVLDQLWWAYSRVLNKTNRLNASYSLQVLDSFTHQEMGRSYVEDMNLLTVSYLKNFVKYNEVKEQGTKQVPFVALSGNGHYLADEADRQEYLRLVEKQQPNLTQKGYDIYKTMEDVNGVYSRSEYLDAYDKGRDVLKPTKDGTMTRDAGLVMRYVKFDKKGNPATEEDEKNHQWNLTWLKAIDEDDFELREKMLAEEIPHRFAVRDLPKPSEKLVALRREMNKRKVKKSEANRWDVKRMREEYQAEKAKFRKELERYTEEKLAKKDEKFFYSLMDGLCYDTLRKAHPSLQQYMDNNPEILKRSAMTDIYASYISFYTGRKYLVNGGTNPEVLGITANQIKHHMENAEMTEDGLTDDYLDKFMAYQEMEKAPYVPYQTIISEEDKKRKANRVLVKAEQEEKRRKEAEERKKYEKIFSEYRKINSKFDEKHYPLLLRTNSRGDTLKNQEYLDLAKQVKAEGFGNALSGAMSFGIETILKDEKGVLDPAYEKAHEKNLAWLNLLIEGDMDKIRQQVKKDAEALVASFALPEVTQFAGINAYYMFCKNPEKVKARFQKLRAYQHMQKSCPQAVALVEEDQKLNGHIRLLLQVAPLVLEGAQHYGGLDFSGDEFKMAKPGFRTKKQEEEFKQKVTVYENEKKAYEKSQEKKPETKSVNRKKK